MSAWISSFVARRRARPPTSGWSWKASICARASIESVVDAVRTAIDERHVVVLRGQHLSAEQHATLARAFGPIQASPGPARRRSPGRGEAGVDDRGHGGPPAGRVPLAHRRELDQRPARARLPQRGRDPRVRRRHDLGVDRRDLRRPAGGGATTLRGIHRGPRPRCVVAGVRRTPPRPRRRGQAAPAAPRDRAPARADPPAHGTAQPLPVSALRPPHRRARRCRRPPARARLHAMLDDPHFQIRWRWQAGDLAIWDETSTCHRASPTTTPSAA